MESDQNSVGQKSGMNSRFLWIIIGIAALLRVWDLTGFSLSNDELSALARLQFESVADVIKNGVYPDFHPAGVQMFLYYWTRLFGFSEWIVRIPFAILGVGSVYLIYRIGLSWFGESTGLLSAATLAVLQFPLLYSQIARPYSPGLFFTLLSTFFWTQLIFKPVSDSRKPEIQWLSIAGFILSVSACMYIHYFSFIFAGILCFTGLFFLKRNAVIPYLLAGAGIALLYLPHLEIFVHQLSKGGVGGADGWLGPPDKDAFGKYLDYCFNESSQLKLLFFIITSGTILLYRRELKLSRFHLVTIIFFLVPFAIAYFYSIWKNPVFQHSVLLFSFPYLLLLLFSFLPPGNGRFTLKVLLIAILTGGIYSTVYEKKYYTTAHFSEFRGIAKRVKELDDKFGQDNITRTISVFSPYYIQYYLDKVNHPARFELTSVMTREERRKFRQIVERSRTPYFVHAFSNVYDDPDLDLVIRSRYPWILLSDSMLNSGLRFYSKERSDSALNTLPFITVSNSFENNDWSNEAGFRDSTIGYDGNSSILLNPTSEFSPGFEKKLKDFGITSGTKVEASLAFLTKDISTGAKLVISVDSNDKNILWHASSLSDYATEDATWSRVFITTQIPFGISGDEIMKVYCWNEKKETLWIDDFKMNFYSPR